MPLAERASRQASLSQPLSTVSITPSVTITQVLDLSVSGIVFNRWCLILSALRHQQKGRQGEESMKTGTIILSAALAAGLAVAACPTLSAAQAQSDCAAWNSSDFFETASAGDVRACLQAGADLEARGEYGSTPLHRAAIGGHVDAITALLEAGADPKARTEGGSTPLHWAAIGGHADAITALLEAGADLEARSEGGTTPLHWVAWDGSADAITALLEAGADPMRKPMMATPAARGCVLG